MLLSCPLFQSTLPARGATTLQGSAASVLIFQSTLPARGATSARAFALPDYLNFNPRSPHGERPAAGAPRKQRSAISIHAPRTGSDERSRFCPAGLLEFQSTLPARGATLTSMDSKVMSIFQSTLPARGATFRHAGVWYIPISIHAPRTGSDVFPAKPRAFCAISIHAPRTGSDASIPGLSPS